MPVARIMVRVDGRSSPEAFKLAKPGGNIRPLAIAGVGDLFDDYVPAGAWDEMFVTPTETRDAYQTLREVLGTMSGEDFRIRCGARDRSFRDQGITFSLLGEERPFPLDLVPRVIPAQEWTLIEAGIVQRVRALEAFLDDIYSAGQVTAEGIVPRRLVTSSSHFHREAFGLRPPNGVRVHVSGVDLVRDGRGRYLVLEDNLRTPSGISYVIENRRAMTHVFPELFASHRVRPVADYPARLLEALRAAAPPGRDNPNVVVLTPGVHNAAYFEHSFLARQMGVELVEGRDLICRDGFVAMRSTSGEQRVDVVYRRVDDDYLDPLHFRPGSLLGCPGILNAARMGRVSIANAIGNGVADDKAIYPYVPALIRYYLGAEPILGNVDTYLLDDPDVLSHVLAHLDQLVLKPVDGSGGHGLVIGPAATCAQLEDVAARITANPRGWIAQDVIALSTSPTLVGEAFEPRHVDLRPFAVNDGHRIWVAPGGLTRVALPAGSLVVNSSQGGGSKDTWVLSADARPRPQPVPVLVPAGTPVRGQPVERGPTQILTGQQQ
ncbi:MAG: circularly permuted type 2 ATP-grasp protein [Acidimicrobiales bacterium]